MNKPEATYNIYFVMGVSGCGKTTVGKLLAAELAIPFFDGDDFHPEENIEKMSQGFPLTDLDRNSWLLALNQLAIKHQKQGAVIACSALKENYRKLLAKGLDTGPVWIYLKGDFDTISTRLQNRKDHFMPPALLKSQFDTLQAPRNAIVVPVEYPPEKIVKEILRNLSA
jgi:gluconokinase